MKYKNKYKKVYNIRQTTAMSEKNTASAAAAAAAPKPVRPAAPCASPRYCGILFIAVVLPYVIYNFIMDLISYSIYKTCIHI